MEAPTDWPLGHERGSQPTTQSTTTSVGAVGNLATLTPSCERSLPAANSRPKTMKATARPRGSSRLET